MRPRFFATQDEFREWLRENHDKCDELIVGYYKVSSEKPSMTWPESVDQALCFGWIDGIRRKIDDESYSIRFTPRRPSGIWSKVNIEKVEKLKKAGLMRAAGLSAYEKRTDEKSGTYSYEGESPTFSKEFKDAFKKNKEAWDHFKVQPPYARKLSQKWVMSAKMDKTRERRLAKVIAACEKGEKLV
ncbi:MAG: YdeI/OmpD-associated family protein [Acidobacteriota bacterium]|nr:MAG: YdeI/OmpD-associated family protein [Acidobacteriota bacterium]